MADRTEEWKKTWAEPARRMINEGVGWSHSTGGAVSKWVASCLINHADLGLSKQSNGQRDDKSLS